MKEKENFLKVLKTHRLPRKIMDTAASLDRKVFFDEVFADRVYTGEPVPTGHGQKSDEINTLARMLKILKPDKKWRLLEIGTGSGYSTALLSSVVREMVSVDYYEDIALKAKERVLINGFRNVKFYAGDFTEDFESAGLFDAVIVFAGCRNRPFNLLSALKPDGVMVFPMGLPHQQQIVKFDMPSDAPVSEDSLKNCSFHDLCYYDSIKGVYGWE